jgi:hypothetical protein
VPPSFRDGETASLSFVDPVRAVTPAGATTKASVGIQDLSGTTRTWTYSAATVDGITLSPATGSISVPGAGKASASVTVNVPAGTSDGSRKIPVTFSTPGLNSIQTVLTVLVAQPGSWLATVNNAGISNDGKITSANFDGYGWNYSAEALAAAGATAGATITVDGLGYKWSSYPGGEPDNVIAQGQTVNVSGGGRLALLGSGSGGNSSGTLKVTYTDGTTSTVSVGFSDWTLGGGSNQPSFGNRIALSTAYRNSTGGGSQAVKTMIFTTAPVALDAGKTVASVTLPSSVTGGQMHVFGIAVG